MGTDGLLFKCGGGGAPLGEELHVAGAAVGGSDAVGDGFEPFFGNEIDDGGQGQIREALMSDARRGGNLLCPGEEDVVLDLGERGGDLLFHAGPVVVKEEGGAVVDGVELTVPDEEVGIARRAVDVLREGVEPDEHGGFIYGRGVARGGVEHGGAGEVVESEVEAGARFEKLANFVVGIVAAEGWVDLDEDDLGNAEAKGTADFASEEFGDEGEDSLPCSAEFDDVEAEVVGFYNRRQGSAFAQGDDVTGRSGGS